MGSGADYAWPAAARAKDPAHQPVLPSRSRPPGCCGRCRARLPGRLRPAARAQFSPGPIELSGSVNLDEADSAVRAHLERVKAYVADRQWDEAVETLRQVMENHGAKMIPLTPTRYRQPDRLLPRANRVAAGRGAGPLSRARRSAGRAMVRRGTGSRATRRGWPKSSTRCFAAPGATMRCGPWARSSWSKGNHGAARRYWERLIEVPPARIPAARFEAAREQAGLAAPSEAALFDQWYAIDVDATPRSSIDCAATTSLTRRRGRALVQFWKSQRLSAHATGLSRHDACRWPTSAPG